MTKEKNDHSAGLAAVGNDTGRSETETASEIAALRLERDRYKRALENHLCAHDMADWMGCHFNHVELCAICQHDNGTEHTWLVRLERANAAAVQLRAITAEWRVTADAWEAADGYWPKAEGVAQPPERGRSSIRNWVNWLRGCADSVEQALAATKATTEVSSAPAASPALKETSQSANDAAVTTETRPTDESGYRAACNICGREWKDGQEVGKTSLALAAPALYEALQAIVSYNDSSIACDLELLGRYYDHARAALKLADGQPGRETP